MELYQAKCYPGMTRLAVKLRGPETQLCPGKAKRKGQSAASWMPMRAVTSTSGDWVTVVAQLER